MVTTGLHSTGIGVEKGRGVRLTETVHCAGCAAKIGPGALKDVLNDLPLLFDPRILRGMESLDNAGVFQLTDDLAIVQTVDFFPPLVDDPYTFGQIAVANALSDAYTMGGTPITAMNLVCFPIETMDVMVLKDILRGGGDKLMEARCALIGGHSIDDHELKFGVSVTATVHPRKLVTNSGDKPGDKVILTKALGTGITINATKAGKADEATIARVIKSMTTLNDKASKLMLEAGVHSATDITGFGFLGHIIQLANNSHVGINIDITAVPFFPKASEFASMGLCPGGLFRNQKFYSPSVNIASYIPSHIERVLYDPQTSGGLLMCLAPEQAGWLLGKLRDAGITDAAIVGEVVDEPRGMITIR